jgi:hypothetical protein
MAKPLKFRFSLLASAILASYCLVITALLWPAFFPPAGKMLASDDFARQHVFFQETFVGFLKKDVVAWWNPYQFSGAPYAATPTEPLWYPPIVLLHSFPLVYSYPLFIAFHLLIAMTGMYFLMRRVLKLNIPVLASWASGLSFGLSGYFIARMWAGHSDIISSAAYMPFVFGLFYRAMKSKKMGDIVWAGGILFIQLLAGYQTIVVFTLEAVGIAAVFIAVSEKRIVPFVRMILGVVIGFGFAAFQILPGFEYYQNSIRMFPFSYDWSSRGAFDLLHPIGQLFVPFLYGDQKTFAGPPPNYHEQAAYAGAVMAVMAVFAIVAAGVQTFRKKKTSPTFLIVCLFFAIAGVAVWIGMGPNAPINLHKILWDIISFYRTVRYPQRQVLLLSFSVAILGGIGLTYVKHRLLQYFLVAVLCVELLLYGRHFVGFMDVPSSHHDKTLVATLTQDMEPYRFLPNFACWTPPRDSLDFDAPTVYGIYSTTGYDPSILKRYYEFTDAVNHTAGSSIYEHDVQVPYLDVNSISIDYLNVKYVMVPLSYDPMQGEGKFRLLHEDAVQGYRLYENTRVGPRFFLTPDIQILRTREDVVHEIRSGADLTHVILASAEDDPKISSYTANCTLEDSSTVTNIHYGVNDVSFEVNSTCDTFLSSSEVMYPGWKAYANGKELHMFYANHSFRGIFVPKGNYTISMVYEPKMFGIGLAISIFTAFLSAGIVIMEKKRRTS